MGTQVKCERNNGRGGVVLRSGGAVPVVAAVRMCPGTVGHGHSRWALKAESTVLDMFDIFNGYQNILLFGRIRPGVQPRNGCKFASRGDVSLAS